MLRRVVLLLVLFIAVAQAPARAENAMAGTWRGSSGFTIVIPDSQGSFELTFIEYKTERRIVHPARWVSAGREFQWTDRQGASHTATLDDRNRDRIKDVNAAYPNSPAYWYRKRGNQ